MALVTIFSTTWAQGGDTYVLVIKKEGGTGSVDTPIVSEIQLTPVQKYSDDVRAGMVPMRCRVVLLDKNYTNQGRISSLLIAATNTDYWIEITKGGNAFFEGFIEPSLIRRRSGWTDELIEITASDFGILKQKAFNLTGRQTLNKYIYEAIRVQANQSACRVYWETGLTHSTMDAGSPLDRIRINAAAFASDPTTLKWADVMDIICQTYGFRIFRYGTIVLVVAWSNTANAFDIYTPTSTTSTTVSTNTTPAQLTIATGTVPRETEEYVPNAQLREVTGTVQRVQGIGFGEVFNPTLIYASSVWDGWVYTGSPTFVQTILGVNYGALLSDSDSIKTIVNGAFNLSNEFTWTLDLVVRYSVNVTNQNLTETLALCEIKSINAGGSAQYWNGSDWVGSPAKLQFQITAGMTGTIGDFTAVVSFTFPNVGGDDMDGAWIEIEFAPERVAFTEPIFTFLEVNQVEVSSVLSATYADYDKTIVLASLSKAGDVQTLDKFIGDAVTGTPYTGHEILNADGLWVQAMKGWGGSGRTMAEHIARNFLARFRENRLVYTMETLESNDVHGSGLRISYNSKNLRLLNAGFDFQTNRFNLQAIEEANSTTSIVDSTTGSI